MYLTFFLYQSERKCKVGLPTRPVCTCNPVGIDRGKVTTAVHDWTTSTAGVKGKAEEFAECRVMKDWRRVALCQQLTARLAEVGWAVTHKEEG